MRADGIVSRNIRPYPEPQPSRILIALDVDILILQSYVLSWELSNSLDSEFCVRALEAALRRGKPEIFNTDQGSQFTSNDFTSRLLDSAIRISRDGRGRALTTFLLSVYGEA